MLASPIKPEPGRSGLPDRSTTGSDMRTTSRGLIAALALPPLLAGCFAPGDSDAGAGSGGRLRVALAVPPVQALSPYSNDATVLSKLSVAEGLTALDKNGTAEPALAKSWKQDDATTWTFELREAEFQDGTELTARPSSTRSTTPARPSPSPAC